MACYFPLTAYRGRPTGPGKPSPVVFDFSKAHGPAIKLPCGQCIGCRLERSRQWAVRLMHEAQLHEASSFLTLTYSDENLPADGSLNVKHFQDFMKRLRRRIGERLRFFHCGEYGERFARPHYHCILYGFDFPDKLLYKPSDAGDLYTSGFLDSVWQHGHCIIGDVTFESAAYVARYVTKKVTGNKADGHYLIFDPETGEVPQKPDGSFSHLTPEYVTMSRRPGIAAEWFKKFGRDVFPSDEVIVRGQSCRPPRYYDNMFEAAHGDMDAIRSKRITKMRQYADNNTDKRLAARERVALARVKQLKRGFENEG